MSRFKHPQRFYMPKDWNKMPIGFYLRMGRGGHWQPGGQKSELPGGTYMVAGPFVLPPIRPALPELDFDGLNAALDEVTRELAAIK